MLAPDRRNRPGSAMPSWSRHANPLLFDMAETQHNMADYDEAYANWRIEVPEHYNFGFDVIDAWARRDRNKLAMIWTDQQGGERKYTFWDLMSLSNAAANILLNYGIHKGDRVMLMLHRIPEWWYLTIALIK